MLLANFSGTQNPLQDIEIWSQVLFLQYARAILLPLSYTNQYGGVSDVTQSDQLARLLHYMIHKSHATKTERNEIIETFNNIVVRLSKWFPYYP